MTKLVLLSMIFVSPAYAQINTAAIDTLPVKVLDSIIISSSVKFNERSFLTPVEGMNVFAGKKTNRIELDPAKGNLSQNLARMIFAQIPGIDIWDMDGAGTQINIGSRGTDTHRSIEMNMRQNGYNINSDMFGYPEVHYTPPMQGIQRINLVRGSAALQFGSQFGGMMDYIMKEGDTSRSFSFETEQTIGSNNFFNSYNAIGGKAGKVSYYVYYDNRHGDGWRKNASFAYHAYYANLKYEFNKNASLALQFSRMDYRQQIAGGLTDAQFDQDPKQSLRSRNFFSPNINLPAILFNYSLSQNTKLEIIAHSIFGQRNSVQFLNPPNIPDSINTSIASYNPRQVDRDYYNGFTTEARLLHTYYLGKQSNILSGGLWYFEETTKRRQKGVGTSGSDFDISLTKPYGIDLKFHTNNYAAFVENIFQLNSLFTITPGIRYEFIKTDLSGLVSDATVPVSYHGNRNFPLFGAGLQYQVSKATQLYGNISQAYRPYLYANVTPADRIDIVNPNLKDSKGYDIDFGYRGRYKDILQFDINGFYLFYGNKVGQLTLKNQNNTNYLFTTNIGDAVTEGIEAYFSLSFAKLLIPFYSESQFYKFHLLNSFSYNHARYINGQLNRAGVNIDLKNKFVEGVPEWTNRTGLAWQFKTLITLIEFTYVSKSFSDANNTIFNPTGATGIVPAYQVWDWNFNWRFLKHYYLSGGINNLANKKYFTRRINMYPGPGILPADGRTFYLTIGAKL